MKNSDSTLVTDRKYQIFVSSPFSLKLRQEVFNSIINTGNIPIMMEKQSAVHSSTINVIEKAVSESDIYILILGAKYGTDFTEDNGVKISFTHWEYKLAIDAGKHILVFVQNVDEVREHRQALKLDVSKEAEEREREREFNSFIGEVTSGSHYHGVWSENEVSDFTSMLTHAIDLACDDIKSNDPTKGWIHASSAPNIEIFQQSIHNDLRADVHRQFNMFRDLDKRCAENRELKSAIAEVVSDFYCDVLLENRTGIFFDSGSTVAYVAKELGGALSSRNNDAREISVSTNSALAYLHLWLCSDIQCSLVPSGKAEGAYGSTYGAISLYGTDFRDNNYKREEPNYSRTDLSHLEKDRIELLRKDYPSLGNDPNTDTVIIGGISGIKISDEFDYDVLKGHSLDDHTQRYISKCMGIHVGDYHSMLFKRYLYSTNYPVIICLHFRKFNYDIVVGKCHFVFDEKYPWSDFINNHPVGLCIGYAKSEERKILEIVKRLGMHLMDDLPHSGRDYNAIMVLNDAFIKRMNIELN